MENSVVSGLRSRSRSNTPFLRSSCDRENCNGEGDDHLHHKTGRKTPVKRNTPIKQLHSKAETHVPEQTIAEENENEITPPAHRTRQSTRSVTEKIFSISSSLSESNDHSLRRRGIESLENQINDIYESSRVSSTTKKNNFERSLTDLGLSPINSEDYYKLNASRDRSRSSRISGCSSDSSFAELILADASTLVDRDPKHSREHLPSQLYRNTHEYWNKYPKTDFTYSPLSKDRVELAPGQVAVPNMSRRSLSQFRMTGPSTSVDELDYMYKQYNDFNSQLRQRTMAAEWSDDDASYNSKRRRHYSLEEQRWWITRIIISIVTTVTTTTRNLYTKVVGSERRSSGASARQNKGLLSRSASVAVAPFSWIYMVMKKIVTTTVTTVTETITPNHVGSYNTYSSQSESVKVEKKRRWWPWLLLLLLPLVGYGCGKYENVLKSQLSERPVQEVYVSPKFEPDSSLLQRIAALEAWVAAVDSKIKTIDDKILVLDDLEATVESYSYKHLQNNIIQILNINNNNEELAKKLKAYFDEYYISKDDIVRITQEMHIKIINSVTPGMDDDQIRKIIQEYLSVYEKKQMEVLVQKISEHVKKIEVHHVESNLDVEAIKKIVTSMLEIYDADKTGIVDYALESAGGQVLSTRCTELYQIKTRQYSVLGIYVWWPQTSPRHVLTPGAMPAECYAFQGFPGYLILKTFAVIEVTGFSVEHMSKLLAVDGKIESAPKNFSVYGLRDELDTDPHLFGDYMYDHNGTAIQYFPVQHPKTVEIDGVQYPVGYDIIELRVESNHGNPTYTCLYRFKVHGNPVPDVGKAMQDSINDSEGH